MARVSIFTVIGLVATLVPGGCSSSKMNTGMPVEGLQQALRYVVVEGGIDSEEAIIIAENYFWRFGGTGCGGLGLVSEEGDDWIIPVAVGIAAAPKGQIRVKKRDGCVSWEYGPTVKDPKKIWEGWD